MRFFSFGILEKKLETTIVHLGIYRLYWDNSL